MVKGRCGARSCAASLPAPGVRDFAGLGPGRRRPGVWAPSWRPSPRTDPGGAAARSGLQAAEPLRGAVQLIASTLVAAALATAPPAPTLVEVRLAIPDVVVDLRYATPDNFMERPLYPAGARCLLLKEAVDRLSRAASALRERGLRLRLFDCYRPHSVQWEMWKRFPKPGYVADPRRGSAHNRGAALDLTLAAADGTELRMPTRFDAFERAAHHDFPGVSAEVGERRALLREVMRAAGFRENRMEWWHYELPRAGRWPVQDVPVAAGPRTNE